MIDNIGEHNRKEIERTNQRGGAHLDTDYLMLFIKVLHGSAQRRVTSIWYESGGELQKVFHWDSRRDLLKPT